MKQYQVTLKVKTDIDEDALLEMISGIDVELSSDDCEITSIEQYLLMMQKRRELRDKARSKAFEKLNRSTKASLISLIDTYRDAIIYLDDRQRAISFYKRDTGNLLIRKARISLIRTLKILEERDVIYLFREQKEVYAPPIAFAFKPELI